MQLNSFNIRTPQSAESIVLFLISVFSLIFSAASQAAEDSYSISPKPKWAVATEFNPQTGVDHEGSISYQLVDKQTYFDGSQASQFSIW